MERSILQIECDNRTTLLPVKGLVSLVLSCLCVWGALALPAQVEAADVPYYSYFMSPNGYLAVPAPYEPAGIIALGDHTNDTFDKPQDLFIDDKDRLYVADTGNNRIVSMDSSGNILQIFGADEGMTTETGKLNAPRGIYVDESGMIYVADTGNQRVVQFAQDGRLHRVLANPDSPLLGQGFSYQPAKLIVDSRKYIYVISQGNQKGLIMLDSEGGFRGFFGGNKPQSSFTDTLVRMIYSKEQRRSIVNLPFSFNNLFNSSDGFIYATTTGTGSKQVRKLDAVGGDAIPARDFSDGSLAREMNKQNFIDVAVDAKGNMTIIDRQFGRMYQYDDAGRMLFAFGSNGSGQGLLASATAIEVDSRGILYVLDERLNHIQKFQTTPFAQYVHHANELYHLGKYEEAVEPWQEVLRLNSYYTLALQAMGQIRVRQERFPEAMDYFRSAYDKTGYSEAFYEQRRITVSDHFTPILITIVGGMILFFVGQGLLRRRKSNGLLAAAGNNRPMRLIKQAYWVMTHPFQGFEALRYEGKGRIGDALILVAAFTAVNLLSPFLIGFLYESRPLDMVQWGTIIRNSILPWVLWSVVGFGISTISDGEGRFRDVWISAAYCLTPLLFFTLPLTLLTQVISLREANFYNLFHDVLLLWTMLLMFIQVKETHNYDFGKALRVTLVTLISCAIVIGLYLIFYGLAVQVIAFVGQVFKEDILSGT